MNYWTSVKLHLLYKPELTFFGVYYDTGTYWLGLVLLWNDFSSREWSRFGLSQIKFFGFCDFLWRFPWQNSFAHFAGKLIQKFVNLTAPSDQKYKEHNIATMFSTMFGNNHTSESISHKWKHILCYFHYSGSVVT